mgnify:FL=1
MQTGDGAFVLGASVFSVTMILLYLASTVYHYLPQGNLKSLLSRIDHCAIYLFIAGTYTPFTLGVFRGFWGWVLLAAIWAVAAAGVALKVFANRPHPILSTTTYLVMGWLILIFIKPFMALLSAQGIFWLVAGGVAYSLGVIFFVLDSRFKYSHFIWHLFVILGTVCHFIAIYYHAA